MADPQFEEKLDGLDRLTVRLYRLGLALAGGTLLASGGMALFGGEGLGLLPLMALACALIASSMHIYDKQIRWFLMGSTWSALMLYPAISQWLPHTSLFVGVQGLLFVTLSGIALKEQYCFKILALKWVPGLLVGSIFSLGIAEFWPETLGWFNWLYGATGLAAGGLYSIMAVAKWRQPLHFDIGEKAKYQI